MVRGTLQSLADHGAITAIGGCGFFARVHREFRDEGPIPFLSSAVVQVPWLRALYGDPVGALTIDETSLSEQWVRDVGWSRTDPASLFWHRCPLPSWRC